ncbi:hypothetical protein LI328DRAFT_170314 [Trichoderma asperelloides]|nr:hypothetical protein LI328DRAFT_170314 [Trichoderma asperelloides]
MHTDVAAPTPASWVLMMPRYRQQRTLPVNATPETRPAARLAPKGAVSSKAGATIPSPLFRDPIRLSASPPTWLLIEPIRLQTERPARLPPHLHVPPLTVDVDACATNGGNNSSNAYYMSYTSTADAQQMHMIQNGNCGATTTSIFLCSSTCQPLKRRWCGRHTELCDISPSSPTSAATQLQLVYHDTLRAPLVAFSILHMLLPTATSGRIRC